MVEQVRKTAPRYQMAGTRLFFWPLGVGLGAPPLQHDTAVTPRSHATRHPGHPPRVFRTATFQRRYRCKSQVPRSLAPPDRDSPRLPFMPGKLGRNWVTRSRIPSCALRPTRSKVPKPLSTTSSRIRNARSTVATATRARKSLKASWRSWRVARTPFCTPAAWRLSSAC